MPDAQTEETLRSRELASPSRDSLGGKLEGEDRKVWDRASIALRSHPLHPFPRVSQADFLLPSGDYRLKLAGDCLVFGVCMALLAFFPLWVMDVFADGAWANWVWGSMTTIGFVSAVLLFVAAPRRDRKYLEKL